MLTMPVVTVRCVNCGPATGNDILTGIGLAAAAIGVIVAIVALVVAIRSLTAAQDSLKIAQTEHQEFMQQLTARARFDLSIRALDAGADGALEIVGASMANARFAIRLANTGDKASGPTNVEVRVPGSLRNFVWTDAGGTSYEPRPIASRETLRMPDGRDVTTQLVTTQVPRVSTRTPVVLYIMFLVEPSVTQVPVRIKAGSDDLPDDEGALVHDAIVQIRWLNPVAV